MKTEKLKKKHVHKRRKIYLALLALPPTVAMVLMGLVISTSRAPVISQEGFLFSPVDPTPLIFSLTLFIIGYVVFISLIFKEEMKKLLLKVVHKS